MVVYHVFKWNPFYFQLGHIIRLAVCLQVANISQMTVLRGYLALQKTYKENCTS